MPRHRSELCPPRPGWGWRGAVLVAALSAVLSTTAGCAGGDPDGSGPDSNLVAKGELYYRDSCSLCHGSKGQGGLGPPLSGWTRSESDLIDVIERTMPKGRAGTCTGACARDTAAYILAGFASVAPTCGDSFTSPRRLRLLTQREYRTTVADLFPSLAQPGGGACGATTFTLYPGARTPGRVHVAGSFNGWAGTVAAGGWALSLRADKGVWTADRTLQPGTYAYKFVLDERDWVADDRNPVTTPDGFGGQNSVLTVSCGGAPRLPFDPLAGASADTRAEGYLFDNHADARLVTQVEVDQYFAAAKTVADAAVKDYRAVTGCDLGADRDACAASFVRRFGRRAFRRPLSDDEARRYQGLVTSQADPQKGVSLALQVFLSSPSFLYRSEMGQPADNGRYRLTGYEVASALSYLLWGTLPDAALLDAAQAGELDQAEGLERHARRLLTDPRSRDAVGGFVLQWLGADKVRLSSKAASFSGFTDEVRALLAQETQRFGAYVAFQGTGRFDELLQADYGFLSAALAPVYGGGLPAGDLQQRPYGDGRRLGLLGHGSVLATYAYPDQTSPVRRGLFVRRNLLCQDLPPPPALPGAGSVPQTSPDSTTRERFNQHTQNPACASCHQFLDPLGFGFEHFDPIGAWRDQDAGRAIDASAELRDVEQLGAGTQARFDSLPALARLLAGSDAARGCFARQYYRFARGVLDSPEDVCARDQIQARFRDSGGDLQRLMLAVVLSPDFVLRR